MRGLRHGVEQAGSGFQTWLSDVMWISDLVLDSEATEQTISFAALGYGVLLSPL